MVGLVDADMGDNFPLYLLRLSDSKTLLKIRADLQANHVSEFGTGVG
jgi:hypothetical protein